MRNIQRLKNSLEPGLISVKTRFLKNTTSWLDFASHLSGLNGKEKGDTFESLVAHYLRLHPTYATQLETGWLLHNV
jgi:hypothetical protein